MAPKVHLPVLQSESETEPEAAEPLPEIPYVAEPVGSESRIVVRIAVAADGRLARLRAHALAWGDLVMMRRQLLNLKALAERDAAATA